MTQVPESAKKAALDAAFPGLPRCMDLSEARRRTNAALEAAYPVIRVQVEAELVARFKAEIEECETKASELAELDIPWCNDQFPLWDRAKGLGIAVRAIQGDEDGE